MIKYQYENDFHQLKEEILNHVGKHWDEADKKSEAMSLNIDWNRYEELMEAGNLAFISARNENGDMVGYIMFLLYFDPHSKEDVIAGSDIIYVSPEYRGQGICEGMLEKAEEVFKEAGLSWMNISFTSEQEYNLPNKLGYKKMEVIHGKSLKGNN